MTSTTTTQPLSRAYVENAVNKDTTEAGSNILDIQAVFDSLNRRHETLSRHDHAVIRKKEGNNGGITTLKKYQAW